MRIEPTFHKRTPDRWTIEVIGLAGIRMFSVEATGPDDEVAIAWANEMADLVFRPVVPEDRPAPDPDHWCNCPPDVCRGIGPDAEGCSWCWAKDTDDPCPNARIPEDRPAQCPKCDAPPPDHYQPRWGRCDDPWHAPAGVPVLDDDTRREVERIVADLREDARGWRVAARHVDYRDIPHNMEEATERERIAELLAAAYLGGTDGR